MRTRRNWLKTTIAMLTLVATVLETGFSTVTTFAAETVTEDGIVVNNDAVEETDESSFSDDDLQIEVTSDDASDEFSDDASDEFSDDASDEFSDDGEAGDFSDEAEPEDSNTEDTALSEDNSESNFNTYSDEDSVPASLSVSSSGISGSGYDEVSIFVDTDNLDKKDKFRIVFNGPGSASYNPAINDDLDKTYGGRYDFINLEGSSFDIYATSSDDVILSYKDNGGDPVIVVESRPAEKVLDTKTLKVDDGTTATALVGSGYDSFTIDFDTKELSKGVTYKLFVESDAEATVDGKIAANGVTGLGKDTDSVTIENLEGEEFEAYVVVDDRGKVDRGIESDAQFRSADDGQATIIVKDYTDGTYKYEDDKVLVTGTVQKKGALPADAFFYVEPLTQEDAQKYLETLNENSEDGFEYTEENTLLYDIGFYTDDTLEEEIEPEAGSVTFTIEFKKDQLADDLGAEDSEDIEVNHFVEEGSRIELDEQAEAEVAGDIGSVEITTDSFSVFALSHIGANTVKVQITGPAQTYYAAVCKNVDGNRTFIGDAQKVVVSQSTSEQIKLNPWDKQGFAEIVLLAPKAENFNYNADKVDAADIENTFNVYGDGDFYNNQNVIIYEAFDYQNALQKIKIGSANSADKSGIEQYLKEASNFTVVANDFTQSGHIEGNVAANTATFMSGQEFGYNGNCVNINLKIKVEKCVIPAAAGSFKFGIFDSKDNKVGEISVTTGGDGYGSNTYTINNAKDSYTVFELDNNGNKVQNNGKANGYTVTYVSESGLNNYVANYGASSFAKNITNSGQIMPIAGTTLYTTSSGVSASSDKGKIVVVSSDEFAKLINITGMLNDLKGLSSALAGTTDSGKVKVYNIKGQMPNGDNGGHYNFPAVGSDQVLVLNIYVPSNAGSNFNLSSIFRGGPNSIHFGNEQLENVSYEKDGNASLVKRTIWNFLDSNGNPYTGKVTHDIGMPIGGTFLVPAGSFHGTNKSPIAIYAQTVTGDGSEIHKGGFTFDVNNSANIAVTNSKENVVGNLEIEKKFEGINGDNLSTQDKQKIKFTVTGPNGFNQVITYDQFTNKKYVFNSVATGEYKVVEENGYNPTGYACTTTYSVADGKTTVVAGQTAKVKVTNKYNSKRGILAICKSYVFDGSAPGMPIRDFYFKIIDHATGQQVTGFKMVNQSDGKLQEPYTGNLIHVHFNHPTEDEMYSSWWLGETRYYYTETVFAIDLPLGTYDIVEVDSDGNEVPDSVFGWKNSMEVKKLTSYGDTWYPQNDNDRKGLWNKYADAAHQNWYPVSGKTVKFTEKEIVWNVHMNNQFKPQGEIPLNFIKKVKGTPYTGNAQFTFKMEGMDNDSKAKLGWQPKTVKNTGKDISFPAVQFQWSDINTKEYWQNGRTYKFRIYEDPTAVVNGYGIDKSEYEVDIIVKRPQNNTQIAANKLDVTAQYYRIKDKDGNNVSKTLVGTTNNSMAAGDPQTIIEGAFFDNTYGAKGKIHVYARKIYNRPLNGKDFNFELKRKNNQKLTILENNQEKKVDSIVRSNDAAKTADTDGLYRGWIDFGWIVYTDDDAPEDFLVVSETSTKKNDDDPVTYHTESYEIRITIADNNSNGELEVKSDKYCVEFKLGNDVSFYNTYLAKNDIEFKVRKAYEGKEFPTTGNFNRFNFKLQEVTNEKGEGEIGDVKQQTVDVDKTETIAKFTYDSEAAAGTASAVGTHYYKIWEVTETRTGVVFDDKYYVAKVVVTNDGVSDKLVKKTTLYTYEKQADESYALTNTEDKDTTATIEVTFTNRYEVIPTEVPVQGEKILISNKDGVLESGKFTFKLEAYGTTAGKTGYNLPATTEVLNGNTGDPNTFKFDNIKFTEPGTYEFKVSEVPGNDDYIYSNAEYIVTIKIADVGGKLEQDGNTTYKLVNGEGKGKISFINYEGGVNKPIFVRKRIESNYDKLPEANYFEFELFKADGTTKIGASQFNDAAGNAKFDPEVYDELNYDISKVFTPAQLAALTDTNPEVSRTYTYIVKEKAKSGDGYEYDGSSKTVTITVTYNKNTGLSVDAKNADNTPNDPNGPVVFTNKIYPEGEIQLGGYKELLGRKFTDEDNGKWIAAIYHTEGTTSPAGGDWVANGTGKVAFSELTADINKTTFTDAVKTWFRNKFGNDSVENHEAGFMFDKIYFTKPGTYYYTVEERQANTNLASNVSVDRTVYNVVVKVEDNGTVENGVAKLDVSQENNAQIMLFVNPSTADGSVDLQAKKVLWEGYEGDPAVPDDDDYEEVPVKAGDFKFDLVDVTSAASTYKETGVECQAGGHVTFTTINYTIDMLEDGSEPFDLTKVGKTGQGRRKVFTYKITEQGTDTEHAKFDKSEFYADVTVIDDNTAVLDTTSIPVVYYTKDANGTKHYTENDGVAAPKFNNYRTAKTSVPVPVSKRLLGRSGKTDEVFTFKLYTSQTDDAAVLKDAQGNEYTATVSGAVEGLNPEVYFPEITYTLKDLKGANEATKTYYVREVKGNEPGMTYSKANYKVEIKLTRKKDGSIEAKLDSFEDVNKFEEKTFLQSIGIGDKIIFTNNYEASGKMQLVVEKKLQGVTGQLPKNGQFSFTVKGSYEGNTVNETVKNDSDGLAYFTPYEFTKATGDNEYYTFTVKEVIPNPEEAGVEYHTNNATNEYKIYVKVEDDKNGNLVVKTSDDAVNFTEPAKAVINVTTDGAQVISTPDPDGKEAYVPGRITVINKYIPTAVPITLKGKKVLLGKDKAPESYTFKFKLTGDKITGEQTREVVNDGEFSFDTITFTADDLLQDGILPTAPEEDKIYVPSKTFTYYVTEEKINYKGVVYDEYDARKITVELKDDGGKLTATVTSNEKIKHDANGQVIDTQTVSQTDLSKALFEFVNAYGEGELVLPVHKKVPAAPAEVLKGKTFKFQLLEGKSGDKVLETLELTADDNGEFLTSDGKTGAFRIAYDLSQLTKDASGKLSGEFDYRVREESKANSANYDEYTGFTYDVTEYNVHVVVTDNGSGSLSVVKTIESVDEKGNKETKAKDSTALYTFEFTNKYNATGFTKLEGIKVLKGRPFFEDEQGNITEKYEFVLKDEKTGKETTVSSDEKGMIHFGTDKYTEGREFNYKMDDLYDEASGKYLKTTKRTYTITEVLPTDPDDAVARIKNGVTYSAAEFKVTVTLTDLGNGSIEAKPVVEQTKQDFDFKIDEGGWLKQLINRIKGDKDPEADFKFTNLYGAYGWTDPPVISKKVMGAEVKAGEFSFTLTDTAGRDILVDGSGELTIPNNKIDKNGNPVGGTVRVKRVSSITSTNDAEGWIEFGDVYYTLDDLEGRPAVKDDQGNNVVTFEYKVVENAPQDGTRPTPAEFTLTVQVYDNGFGKIVRKSQSLVQTKGNAFSDKEYENIFLNTFNAEGYIEIPFKKFIDGRDITTDDAFEFEITDLTNKENKPKLVYNINSMTVNANNEPERSDVVFSPNAKLDDGRANPYPVEFLKYEFGAFDDPQNPGQLIKKEKDLGTHKYLIKETGKNLPDGVGKDDTEFEVTVEVKVATEKDPATGKEYRVKNSEGKYYLTAEITEILKKTPIPGSTGYKVDNIDVKELSELQFNNPYEAKGKTDIKGIKILTDQAKAAKKVPNDDLTQFGFRLYQYDDAARTKGRTLVNDKIVYADNYGRFTLDIPEYTEAMFKRGSGYDKEKTLYYRVEEVLPSEGTWTNGNSIFESKGYIYDTGHYDIDVKVTCDPKSSVLGIQKIDHDTGKILTDSDDYKYVAFTNIEKLFTTIKGTKTWIDKVTDKSERPRVFLDLYSSAVDNGKTRINQHIIEPTDEPVYEFTTDSAGNALPAYDSQGRLITYNVEEENVAGYFSEKNGFDFFNTSGDVVISKIDADTGAPLAGATLAVFDGSTEIERWVSASSAHVLDTAVKYGKTYTLREISAPEGYELAPDQTFSIPADGSDISVTMSDKKIVGSVELTKADSATRETLAGAEFSLFTEAGVRIYATGTVGSYRATSTTSNGTFVTDSTGKLVITDLPYGTYYFTETKAPEGYELSSERLGFTILKTGELVRVTFLNPKAVGSVRLRKVGTTGRSLAGAVFELYAKTPRTAGQAATSTIFSDAYYRYGTYRTNAAGELYVDDLPWDDYYFIEVEAPSGYETAKDVNGYDLVYTFTIGAGSTGTTIDLGGIVNTPPYEPPTSEVLGERIERGGVVNGVLGVRAKPSSGVLGERVGPVTGDTSNIILWALLLGACVATIVATIVTGKKKKTAK